MAEIKIKLTDKDKKALDEFCFEVGLDLETLFRMYIKKIIETGSIPFEIDDDMFYKESNIKALEGSVRQYHNGDIIETNFEYLQKLE